MSARRNVSETEIGNILDACEESLQHGNARMNAGSRLLANLLT